MDDLLIFSWSEENCRQRQRLITMALQKLNLRVSDKLDRTVRQEGHLVGLKFVPGGVVVSDEAADALKIAMQMEVKNLKDARHLIGILVFAQAAFEWDLTHMTWYAERMAVLNEATTQPKFVWSDECKAIIEEMLEKIDNAPRISCRPQDLLDAGWVLCIKSDASGRGLGACLLLVRCREAADVAEEVLADPERVKMIATYSKVLSQAERQWMIFELEAYGMYTALRKWGKLLMQATMEHSDRTMVALRMDSTTAIAKWFSVQIPGEIDFCSAKEMRFRSWAEKVSYVKYMMMHLGFCPGGLNNWSDLLSRIADKLFACVEERDARIREIKMAPMTRMSYHKEKSDARQAAGAAPAGYEVDHLQLDKKDWQAVTEAYMKDDTTIQNVKISDIYKCAVQGGAGVAATVQMTVKSWMGSRFFVIRPPELELDLICTPRSQIRMIHGSTDNTRVLVLQKHKLQPREED